MGPGFMTAAVALLFVLPKVLWYVAVLWLLWRITRALERRAV
jgi:hypothetical protein